MHCTTQPKTVTLRAPSKYWFVLTVGPWGVTFRHPILDLTHNIHPRSWPANFPVSSSFHTFPFASGLPKSSIFHPTVFRSSPESSILHLPRHIIDSIIPSFHFPWRHHLFSFRPPAASRATSPRGAAHRQRRNGRRGPAVDASCARGRRWRRNGGNGGGWAAGQVAEARAGRQLHVLKVMDEGFPGAKMCQNGRFESKKMNVHTEL